MSISETEKMLNPSFSALNNQTTTEESGYGKDDNELSAEITDRAEVTKENPLESGINKISFLIFGIGMLLPWNAMLAAMDFFTAKFPNF